ncbi:MAG: sulfotransferase, partial [Propionivibrio sp.]|nr:sulfotransferase [Propionivibrio sp.]
MQKESFEIRWTKARQLEASGDVPAAIETYEAILKDEPNRLYARLRVSTLLQMQDKYRRARQHAVDAVESVRHSRWNDLPYVTSKLLTFDEQQLLLEVIRGADWKHRDVITASPMLVQHLWLAGSVDEAVRLAETALQVAPSHLQLNYAYGIALGYAGRLDEAAAAFEKCLVIDPGYAAAHWSLAYTRKRAGTEVDRASRIEAASRREEKAQEKPFLHYAAFKELHDASQYDAAWAHLAEGARIKRGSLDYDALREAELAEWLLGRHGKEPVNDMGNKDLEAVFIVGMPRTGTTVLDRMLGNHPALISAGELSDFRSALNHVLDGFIGAVPSMA